MSPSPIKILILNPNSSKDMTEGMRKAIEVASQTHAGLAAATVDYLTAPASSPASINDAEGLAASTAAALAPALAAAPGYDGVLVACYSAHPLVARLAAGATPAAAQGIMEASVLAALALAAPDAAWGVVTTGRFWEAHLSEGVRAFLGQPVDGRNAKFAGVFTTGLDAADFHGGVEQQAVEARLRDATRALLRSGRRVQVVVMGCAGMAGLEDIIRTVAREEYGEDKVYVVDAVKAGATMLIETVLSKRMFG